MKFRKLRRCQICVCFANVSFLKIQFSTMFAMFQYDFDHNFMRIRSIFDIFDYLNKIHFVFQYEILIVNFIYWMQMLLKCEIREIAKQWRDVEFRNFIKCNSNFEIVSKRIFFKKNSSLFVNNEKKLIMFILNLVCSKNAKFVWNFFNFFHWNTNCICHSFKMNFVSKITFIINFFDFFFYK